MKVSNFCSVDRFLPILLLFSADVGFGTNSLGWLIETAETGRCDVLKFSGYGADV